MVATMTSSSSSRTKDNSNAPQVEVRQRKRRGSVSRTSITSTTSSIGMNDCSLPNHNTHHHHPPNIYLDQNDFDTSHHSHHSHRSSSIGFTKEDLIASLSDHPAGCLSTSTHSQRRGSTGSYNRGVGPTGAAATAATSRRCSTDSWLDGDSCHSVRSISSSHHQNQNRSHQNQNHSFPPPLTHSHNRRESSTASSATAFEQRDLTTTKIYAQTEEQELDDHIATVGNLAVYQGCYWGTMCGSFGTINLPLLMKMGVLEGFELATLGCALGTTLCILTRELARRRLLQGPVGFIMFGIFVNFPTYLFVGCHFKSSDDGALTYLFGPLTYLYALVVLLSAFMFNKWLCISTGTLAALGYAFAAYLAMPHFDKITTGLGTTTGQDMTSLVMWVNRVACIMTLGPTAGALATFGRRLATLAVAEARQRDNTRRLFGEYVSAPIADLLLAQGQNNGDDEHPNFGSIDTQVGGGRTECVMLFCDIRSFTKYSETTDPEEVVLRLNTWFDCAVKACTKHGGVVDKFIGDAIMVVFGGIVPLHHPSMSAAAAAKEMLSECARLSQIWEQEGKPPLRIGIGLHKGPAVLGSIGSSERKDFTVIGDAVNTASRLESMCKKYKRELLVSDTIVHDLHPSRREEWEYLGPAPVSGRENPVELYAYDPDFTTTTTATTTEHPTNPPYGGEGGGMGEPTPLRDEDWSHTPHPQLREEGRLFHRLPASIALEKIDSIRNLDYDME